MEGYLHLTDEDIFRGQWLSVPIKQYIEGDIAFFSGMTGYQEVLKDQAYKDKIVVFTYPLIGNCGVKEDDYNNKPYLAGAIVFEGCKTPSHYESAYSLEAYFNKWNVPLLSHVDTRAMFKKVRGNEIGAAILSTSDSVCFSEKRANEKGSVIEYA